MDFEVDFHDFERIKEAVGATEKIAEKSLLLSLKRTQKWLSTRVGRAVADAAKLPVRAVKARVRLRVPTAGRLHARIWIGLDPMAAGKAGKPRQTSWGVTVGKHKFDQAFVIRGTRVARRVSHDRFPIETVRIHFADKATDAIERKEWPDAQRFLLNEFERQMRWRMERLAAQ